jgi:hypothetical protein
LVVVGWKEWTNVDAANIKESGMGIGLYGCDGTPRWRLPFPPQIEFCAVQPTGEVIVRDRKKCEIQQISPSGQVNWVFKDDVEHAPVSVKTMPTGNLAVLYSTMQRDR